MGTPSFSFDRDHFPEQQLHQQQQEQKLFAQKDATGSSAAPTKKVEIVSEFVFQQLKDGKPLKGDQVKLLVRNFSQLPYSSKLEYALLLFENPQMVMNAESREQFKLFFSECSDKSKHAGDEDTRKKSKETLDRLVNSVFLQRAKKEFYTDLLADPNLSLSEKTVILKKKLEREKVEKELHQRAEGEQKEKSDVGLEFALASLPGEKAPSVKSLDPKSPFADTDMIVYEDDFPDHLMPPKGIKKSDLAHITKTYLAIVEVEPFILAAEIPDPSCEEVEKTEFVVRGNQHFIPLVKNSLKKLMTRKIGREIIFGLEAKKKKIIICQGDTSFTYRSKTVSGHRLRYTITPVALNVSEESTLVQDFKGKKSLDNEIFITLGHEFIHLLHDDLWSQSEKPSLGDDFSNLEEQLTITGVKQRAKFEEQGEDSNFDAGDQQVEYDHLNENALRAAFGIKEFRFDHLGVFQPRKIKIEAREASEEVVLYFREILREGLVDELEAFLKENPDISEKTYLGTPLLDYGLISLVNSGIDNVNLCEKLIRLGANPLGTLSDKFQKKISITNPLNAVQLAASHVCPNILKYLLSLNKDYAKITDAKKNNLLHYALYNYTKHLGKLNEELQIVVMLLEHGVDPRADNAFKTSPLDLLYFPKDFVDAVIKLCEQYKKS